MARRKKQTFEVRNPSIGNTYYQRSSGSVEYTKRVRFLNEDGSVKTDVPLYGYAISTDWTAMKNCYKGKCEVTGDEKTGLVETITLPLGELEELVVPVNLSTKRPMMCLYDATKDFVRKIHGVEFTQEDEEFFIQHPLTHDEGVAFPDTLRVVQELIGPYGLRVSRVQTMPNFGVKGDLIKWQRILGCNPMGMADRCTSNAQFLEKLNLVGKEDPDKYRFEYTPTALFPAIACGVVYGGEASGVTGSTGGHATYIPPRKRVSGALLSFQIERAPFAPWKQQPVFEVLPEKQKKVIDCFDTNDWWNNHRWKAGDKQSGKGFLPVVTETVKKAITGTGTSSGPDSSKPKCFMCRRKDEDREHTYGYAGICDHCWDFFCAEHYCTVSTCADTTIATRPFLRLSTYFHATNSIYLQCPTCHKTYQIKKGDKGKAVNRAIEAFEKYMKVNNLRIYRKDGINSTTDLTPTSYGVNDRITSD